MHCWIQKQWFYLGLSDFVFPYIDTKNIDLTMNKPLLLAGFAVKVLLGLLYGYIFLHYYNGDDTWKLFRASLAETELLLNNPGLFFTNEFTPANALETGRNAFEVISIYLNDLQYVLVVKSMAAMNIVT